MRFFIRWCRLSDLGKDFVLHQFLASASLAKVSKMKSLFLVFLILLAGRDTPTALGVGQQSAHPASTPTSTQFVAPSDASLSLHQWQLPPLTKDAVGRHSASQSGALRLYDELCLSALPPQAKISESPIHQGSQTLWACVFLLGLRNRRGGGCAYGEKRKSSAGPRRSNYGRALVRKHRPSAGASMKVANGYRYSEAVTGRWPSRPYSKSHSGRVIFEF